ncbi:MAG: DUF1501 domain-containing protein [Pirellulaceae bacterium]|nr:DUF1501 domain-containing protein [Pirellulaceae bacterium]MDP6720234.1 DUF1501 domain-containing protein [Pirellulaceae bacterium]
MSHARLNRRQFLHRSSLIAMAPTVPAFLGRTVRATEPNNDGRILVVIQLSGGNDGINTVVPFADEGYAKHRDKLRLSTDRLIKVNDQVGLHPALRPAAKLLENGQLAIVQGVGYPNPNRSHGVSMAIWQTARLDPAEHKTFGWIGRAMDRHSALADGSAHSILLGDEDPPIALRGRRSTSVSLAHLEELKLKASTGLFRASVDDSSDDLLVFARRASLDARSTAALIDEVTKNSASDTSLYPKTELAGRLKSIAQLIKADFSTPVYYAIQSGYDTHAAQLPTHARLLRELAGAMKAFLDDLQAAGLSKRVLTLCFSEFGRRVKENASLGTDHGTAAPVLIAGSSVNSGPLGQPPSMTDLANGDLKMQTDFRQVYATILQDWLGVDSASALGGSFDRLRLIAST